MGLYLRDPAHDLPVAPGALYAVVRLGLRSRFARPVSPVSGLFGAGEGCRRRRLAADPPISPQDTTLP